MRDNTRVSGIDVIGDISWGTYFCQFYRTKEDLLDILVPYFKAGLENKELCIWLISKSLNVDEVKEALRMEISDFDTYLKKGQIEFIPYADWFLKNGIFDFQRLLNDRIKKTDHACEDVYEGLRLSVNITSLEEAWSNFIDYKKEVDNVISSHQAITLFTYSLEKCSPAEIVDIVSNHQFSLIKKKGKWERVENSGWKRAEEKAIQTTKQTTKELEQIFDAIPDLIAIIDNECRIVRANKSMSARLGITPEECIGVDCYRVVHGTDKPPSFCPHKQLLKDGLEHTIELQEDKLGGSFLLSVSPLFSPEGEVIGSVQVARDITERKQAEKALYQAYEKLQAQSEKLRETNNALKESQEKHKTLFDNSLDGIFLTMPDGSILAANPAACKMFGMTEEEIIHAGRDGTVDTSDPRLKPILEERARTGRFKGELNHRRKDGTIFPAEISSAFFKDKNGMLKTVIVVRDTTDRKRAEEALRESEKRYRMLFTNMTEGFALTQIIYDKDGKPCDYRYLEVNPAYKLNSGVKREELLGKTLLEVFPNANPVTIKKFGEVAISGKPAQFEVFSRAVNKYTDIYAFSPEEGKLAIIFRDITERKQTETELQESEEKYRNIVETASEGIWIGDPEARTTYVNKRLTEMLGYTQDEMIGKFAWDFADEEDKPIIRKNIERRRQGIDERYEFKFIRKDGSPIWTIVSSKSLFDTNGKFTGSMSMLTDITQRIEVETKLREILDNLEELAKERTSELQKAYSSLKEKEKSLAEAQEMAHLGNWEWDIATDKVYWSDETYRILGLNPQECSLSFGKILNYIHPDDRDYVDKAIKDAFKGKTFDIDHRIITVNGKERIVHAYSEITFDDKHAPVRIKGTIQDITERKEAEEALEKMEKLRIKEIHHRIKNNLQVISSLLSLQAENFQDEEVLEAFKDNQNRVASMALIHEELFRGRGTDNLDFAAYLQKLTQELFSSYNLRKEDISLKLDLQEAYLGMDTAIPLGIIVNELVSNSLKHAFPNGEKWEISVSLRKTKDFSVNREVSETDSECNQGKDFEYTLTVADNGKGVPEEIDLQNADSLGLQLVNILVEQIDGCIELRRYQGAEFVIWFNNLEE